MNCWATDMALNLDVHLNGELAGHLDLTNKGHVNFTYSHSYQGNPLSTPLSMSLPITTTDHSGN